jgi:transcriptional regulator with XRE-family HTH domain
MVNRTVVRFEDTGPQLRNIREDLRMTLDAVSKETGISRSYISDFERGFRLPTSKYLRYLHDNHQVNLNYEGGRGQSKKYYGFVESPFSRRRYFTRF